MSINICWYEGIAGLYAHEGVHGRSRYACCGLLNEMFDYHMIPEKQHFSGWESLPKDDGAVIMIHGGHLRSQVSEINANINKLPWVICIVMGDEESDFDSSNLYHPKMKLWRQSPNPSLRYKYENINRFIPVGYPCDAMELIPRYPIKTKDWVFAGQVTNRTREDCIFALRNVPNGRLESTKQFYSGLEHKEYFETLASARIAPCPSGPVCPDTFRLYECLQCNCVPLVEEKPGWKTNEYAGFWNMLFGEHPFVLIQHWSEAPEKIKMILDRYPEYQGRCMQWWQNYKAKYFNFLSDDLKSLGGIS